MITLSDFKKFLEIDPANTSKDDLLQECITSAVNEINSLTNRLLDSGLRREVFDGNGTQFAFLKDFPVSQITNLQARTPDGFTDIIKTPDTINDSLNLIDGGKLCLLKGYIFPLGESNILAEYEAGYISADDWKPNTKYLEGVYVVYINILYRCLNDHISGGTFESESDYWQQLTIKPAPADLKKAVRYLAAKNFYDSPSGKNIFLKRSESFPGAYSKSIVYEGLEIEHIINRYKKPNA
jgi:hypothetical protein